VAGFVFQAEIKPNTYLLTCSTFNNGDDVIGIGFTTAANAIASG
jgi:hypothetical protein